MNDPFEIGKKIRLRRMSRHHDGYFIDSASPSPGRDRVYALSVRGSCTYFVHFGTIGEIVEIRNKTSRIINFPAICKVRGSGLFKVALHISYLGELTALEQLAEASE